MPATRPSFKMAPLGQTRRDFQGYHFFALSRKKALLKRLKKAQKSYRAIFLPAWSENAPRLSTPFSLVRHVGAQNGMTSERTVEKVTKMAPVGVRSNGVLQFRGHLNRERWGILRDTVLSGGGENHALPSYCRLEFFRPSAPVSVHGFSTANRRREKRWGLFPSRVSDESTRRVGRSWSPRPVPGPSPWIHGVPDPSRKGWKTRGAHGDVRSYRGKTRLGLNQRWVNCRAHRVGTVIVEGRTDGN